jgi:hypothetical protein
MGAMAATEEIRRRAAPPHDRPGADRERAARAGLRAQIARLERQLATLTAATFPRRPAAYDGSVTSAAGVEPAAWRARGAAAAGPRLLSLGDLERLRDALATRLAAERQAAAGEAARQARARDELHRMLADPAAHRWRRLTNADLGRPGCTTYHVRPRAGLLGLLMGWWQVKISGGCP